MEEQNVDQFADPDDEYESDDGDYKEITSADEHMSLPPATYTSTPRGGHTQFLDLTDGAAAPTQASSAKKSTPAKKKTATARTYMDLDSTGKPKVVEYGKEHTGRWTREEHEAFLQGLRRYGKEWKKVAALVKTRTVVQTRTHAQKYFQKLQKVGDGRDDVPMGVMSSAAKKFSEMAKMKGQQQKQKRLPKSPPSFASALPKPPPSVPRTQSTTAAAHLMTHLASGTTPAQAGYYNPPSASAAAAAAAQHGFGQAAGAPNATFPGGGAFFSGGSGGAAPPPPPVWGSGAKAMSIVAPDPTLALRRGFPEPSPAACGKRKLAELAAAQMLAGVAGGTVSSLSAGIDGDVTPPPEGEAPRKVTGAVKSLQIVNPEALGITHEDRRRGRQGEQSPTTPWDGQLEALIKRYANIVLNVCCQVVSY
jgi:SHAQKYF class myb-like DNA-binding protein